MLHAQELPYGIRCIIAGFGEPTRIVPESLPNGNRQWMATWDGVGIAALWEESLAGSAVIGTFHVSLDEHLWQGRKPIFTQIVDASRSWVTVDA